MLCNSSLLASNRKFRLNACVFKGSTKHAMSAPSSLENSLPRQLNTATGNSGVAVTIPAAFPSVVTEKEEPKYESEALSN